MAKNWHEKAQSKLTLGQRVSTSIAKGMGSWTFVIIQTAIIGAWISGNAYFLFIHFDPFPFIFLNLAFSAQAAYATPLILMAQNLAADRDKVQAEHQYEHQEKELAINTALTKEIHELTKAIHQAVKK